MQRIGNTTPVRASRAGHAFHERWAARKALQLVFPKDGLFAMAVEGISSTETTSPGAEAEEVADLVLYFGLGDTFATCDKLETVQFKYKLRDKPVSASYIKTTIEKFSDTIVGYESSHPIIEVDSKLYFVFVTNSRFTDGLWNAIQSLANGSTAADPSASNQAASLRKWCAARGLSDASRLFSRVAFRAGEKGLAAQGNALRRTLTDWSAGADTEARLWLQGLQDLVSRKAGPDGQGNNLIHREDVLDALSCEPEDLFPADTSFIDVGIIVERAELATADDLLTSSRSPIFVHAEGGVGKTVFVQSLAARMASRFEVVVFDCFGGGSYRSKHLSRHLPRIGLMQIVNELASRTLCDPMLPSSDDSRRIIKAAGKRLAQAAAAIRAQSNKMGVLIIIDAADNAQIEADYRHEQAFPSLLLSTINDAPIDGVQFLFTARTHRRGNVIGRTTVTELELGPFSDSESREFLSYRVPNAPDSEIAIALARSGRNARVLEYLVQTWDANVIGKDTAATITVPEIIAQRCSNILDNIHVAGWHETEIIQFFVALSLLPPPIPLHELAKALEWPATQVNTAASDLAPMLEITSHGAIFRDEPTETYIRDTYSKYMSAQRIIADRLFESQATSVYAAEALPHFLVIIKDSDRAFALADSTNFPTAVQSEFGRRRLTLARLRAAFRLAVAEEDFDRVLGLTMRLAQAVTANLRGDEFIRNAPALAVVLGDADSYRRLYADRSGWRGARSARLTVAHRFAGESEEALVQCNSTIRWINWHTQQPREETHHHRAGPELDDYAAVIFQQISEGEYEIADHNLARWNDEFALAVSDRLLQMVQLFDQLHCAAITTSLVSFAVSDKCTSTTLKLKLLTLPHLLQREQIKVLSKAIGIPAPIDEQEDEFSSAAQARTNSGGIMHAALTVLIYNSRAAARAIIRSAPGLRPSAYDYGERYGDSRIWSPVLHACVRAWSAGRPLAYYDLLPSQVKISKQTKAINRTTELLKFLANLKHASSDKNVGKRGKKRRESLFSEQQRRDIANGIELARELTFPIEIAVLSGNGISGSHVDAFLCAWAKHLPTDTHWKLEGPAALLARAIGLGCVRVLLDHSTALSIDQARILIPLVSMGRFSVSQKLDVLAQLARRPGLEELVGEFARHVAEQIRSDDNIGQRGNFYAALAASLVPMSVEEGREYYRQGLAQLDQMGGESYEEIYSLLHFAATQKGGFLKPALAQRLMNLCQIVAAGEPRKFGWTLFARAAANSIGLPAMGKLVRWHDQDVVNLSYALPQLACLLAKSGNLDPRWAAIVLVICEEHGWRDWRVGDAVADLLERSVPTDQRRIFEAIISKLRAEYPFGAWPSLWEGFLDAAMQYPGAVAAEEREAIELLCIEARRQRDKFNSQNDPPHAIATKRTRKSDASNVDRLIGAALANCDPSSAVSIDSSLKSLHANQQLPYEARQRFLTELRGACPYSKRLAFLSAVCEAAELSFDEVLEILTSCFSVWSTSSTHLASNIKPLVEILFGNKGGDFLQGQFTNVVRGVRQLSDLCSDTRFVLQLVLRKVAADEVEFGGDEWLQLAAALLDVTSERAGLESLELLLAGPAARIADEIGEGCYRAEQVITGNESEFLADVIWHLLGDDDAYVRWRVARSLETLVRLGLVEVFGLLLCRFDEREVASLASPDRKLSFQNSQQWLLMGLARTALHHPQAIEPYWSRLLALSERHDLHVIHKLHIFRCLRNISSGERDSALSALQEEISKPLGGAVAEDDRPPLASSAPEFDFDYDFSKAEIGWMARLFNVTRATAEEAIAAEIVRQWPEATSLDSFPGRDRYQWSRDDRFEFYREHIQRHALISATTRLSKKLPVVIPSYEIGRTSPWIEWRDRYDVTFDDGSWLSDWKDPVPQQAKEDLLRRGGDHHGALEDQQILLCKLGLVNAAEYALFPLYGRWSSPDGVYLSLTSALVGRKGAVGRCASFAKQASNDLWLPEFWDEGHYDQSFRLSSPFAPLVWVPEKRGLGIDVGDELAARGPAGRPRLGIDLTRRFGLINELNGGDWRSGDGSLAVRSQVWGEWKTNPDDTRYRDNDDGEILLASRDWLAAALSALDQRLVLRLELWKHASARSYDTSIRLKLVLVGLRGDDGGVRVWESRNASKTDY